MKRGDVVLVDWLFSDHTGSKLRPAVLVQSDALNNLIPDSVLVAITGTSRGAVTEVEIDPATEPRSGLKFTSYAVCNNLLTIDQGLIYKRLGELSSAVLRRLEDGIKLALELP
jgi:mRNA interferase MazF